ncbi:MAG: SDR family NAD(P)-dependent oxidoreductase, partial [Chloracidobacterium sp.]|nr:SDR family NAD(P)-dependent oxidoreductase [Chloracidobacterium sp.]
MIYELSTSSVAVVTGASSGIGRATALALAERGLRLALLARSENVLSEVADEARRRGASDACYFICDVRNEAVVDRAVASTLGHFGRIDILINCAGLSLNGMVDGYSLEDWRL